MAGTDDENPAPAGANPYVGPQPFPPGRKLYGRDTEVRELFHLLMARRVVVLHSPSGAGKSSLLQAALLPRLKEERFDVWRTVRVHLDPESLGVPAGVNRFLASTLACLEDGVPRERRRPVADIAGPSSGPNQHRSLVDYLESRPRRPSAPPNVVLIFDQFEEILTVDPVALAAKHEFFAQLGEALRHPRYWALFALREDYLAAFAPYRDAVPTRLAHTFRLDLLGLEAAREAIVEPAREGGRSFPAADTLVCDLSEIKVQQPDGSLVSEQGNHVEPVQLQVVCWRLWNSLPPETRSIEADDLAAFGDVDQALAAYYRDALASVAAGDPSAERAIRDFFAEKLITAGGLRGQVLREVGRSGGLDNSLIDRVLDTHLLRAEKRAGATWYELAHDRLLTPVQQDNEAWRSENLKGWQQRATMWWKQDRPESLLLRDAELATALLGAKLHAGDGDGNEVDRRYLEESKANQRKLMASRRQAFLLRVLGWVSVAVSFLAVLAFFYAWHEKGQAEQERAAARSVARAATALVLIDQHHNTEAGLLALEFDDTRNPTAVEYLRKGAVMPIERYRPVLPALPVDPNAVVGPFFCGSPLAKHSLLAWTGAERTLRIFDWQKGELVRDVTLESAIDDCALDVEGEKLWVATADGANVYDPRTGELLVVDAGEVASPSPDGERLLVGTATGWSLSRAAADGGKTKQLGSLLNVDVSPKWSSDGQWVAVPTTEGAEIVSLANPQLAHVKVCATPGEAVLFAVELNPDGSLVLCRYGHKGPELWDARNGKLLAALSTWHPTSEFTFSPDGEHVLGVRGASVLLVAETDALREGAISDFDPLRLTAEAAPARAVWSDDGQLVLAVSRATGTARISEIREGKQLALIFDPNAKIADAAFTPDARIVATLTDDRQPRFWDFEADAVADAVASGVADTAAGLAAGAGATANSPPSQPGADEGHLLQARLRARNRLCLPAEFRRVTLGEAEDEAEAMAAACNRCVPAFYEQLDDAPTDTDNLMAAWLRYRQCLEE